MFPLHDLRKTRFWQEAYEEGIYQGRALVKIKVIRNCMARGMPAKEIAKLMDLTVQEVRRLAKDASK